MAIASAAQLGAAGHHHRTQWRSRAQRSGALRVTTIGPSGDRERSAAGRGMPVAPPRLMPVRLRDVWSLPCRAEPLTVGVLVALTLTGCGSGDSTVAKTPQPTTTPTASITAPATPVPADGASPGPSTPADPCAVNLASPTIAKVVSDLPRDPRSQQAWNPEPLAGNYNQCAQLSAVIIKANTNAVNATTRAVLFHLGQFIPQGVPDTYGFNGIDAAQTTGDTVALTYPSGINGLNTDVRLHWNGNSVELIGNSVGR